MRKSERCGAREWERFPFDCPQSYMRLIWAHECYAIRARDFPSGFNFGFCQNLLTRTTFPTRNDVKLLANTQRNVHTIWYHTMIILFGHAFDVFAVGRSTVLCIERVPFFTIIFSISFRLASNSNRFGKKFHWQRANETHIVCVDQEGWNERADWAYWKKGKSLGKWSIKWMQWPRNDDRFETHWNTDLNIQLET